MSAQIKVVNLTKFNSMDDVKNFVKLAGTFSEDFKVTSGTAVVDAKSLLGMMYVFGDENKNNILQFTYSSATQLAEIMDAFAAWINE